MVGWLHRARADEFTVSFWNSCEATAMSTGSGWFSRTLTKSGECTKQKRTWSIPLPSHVYQRVDMCQTAIFVTNLELLPFGLGQTSQRGLNRQSEGHILCSKSLSSHSSWEHVCLSEKKKTNGNGIYRLTGSSVSLSADLNLWPTERDSNTDSFTFFEINFSARHMQSQYWTIIRILTGLSWEFSKQRSSPDVCHITGSRWKMMKILKKKKKKIKKGEKINPHHVMTSWHTWKALRLLWDYETQKTDRYIHFSYTLQMTLTQ